MRNLQLFLTLLATIIAFSAYSQFEPIETISIGYVRDGIPCDVDQDGDMDLVLYSSMNQSIYWRENVNSDFSTSHDILPESASVNSIKTGDLDNDGDMDIVTLGFYNLLFFENTDGQGAFTEGTLIADELDGCDEVYVEDVDSDGDVDILLRYDSYLTNKISWFENINNTLEFEAEATIYDPSEAANSVCFAQLDGNQNVDMVAGFNDSIICVNNFDNGSFDSAITVTTNVDGVESVKVADLNGDGYNDILAASHNDLKLSWYKNTGTGSFESQQLLVNNYLYAYRLIPADIDNDDDVDLIGLSIVGAYFKNMFYYENTGSGNFNNPQNIVENAAIMEVFVGDVDNDNDIDIFTYHQTDLVGAGSFGLNKNQLITVDVNNNQVNEVETFPNPVVDHLNLVMSDDEVYSFELYDVTGKLILTKSNIFQTNTSIQLGDLKNGIYIGKLISNNQNGLVKEFKVMVRR